MRWEIDIYDYGLEYIVQYCLFFFFFVDVYIKIPDFFSLIYEYFPIVL